MDDMNAPKGARQNIFCSTTGATIASGLYKKSKEAIWPHDDNINAD
jgi:hypothetical protein